MKAWPGEWWISESPRGTPDCDALGSTIYIVAEGGWVAEIKPCDNPRRAFKDNSLTDQGAIPGCEGYETGLAIARATAKEIVDAHNSMSKGLLNL